MGEIADSARTKLPRNFSLAGSAFLSLSPPPPLPVSPDPAILAAVSRAIFPSDYRVASGSRERRLLDE